MDLISKAKQNTLDAMNLMFEKEANVKKHKFYLEAEGDLDKGIGTEDAGMEPVAPEEEKEPFDTDDEGKDTLDTVDEILEKIDMASLDNDTKVELITSLIDSIQNTTESDEEFSDVMNQLVDVIENYKFEKEGEGEEEEEGEEGGEEGGEEEVMPEEGEGEETPEE
jgi:hypothetical protein